MITLQEKEKLIDRLKQLTELELLSLFEEFREHVYMNSLQNMIHKALGTDDVFGDNEELNEEVDRLEDQVSDLKEELEDAEMKALSEDLTIEDNLAQHLSAMSPMDYESLTGKVNRDGWQMTGFKMKPFRKQ